MDKIHGANGNRGTICSRCCKSRCQYFVKNGGVSTVSHRDGIYGQIVLKVDEQFSLANLKDEFSNLVDLANQNLPAWLVMVVVLALFRLDNKVI